MAHSNIIYKINEVKDALSELRKTVENGDFYYTNDDCVLKEFERIANDAHDFMRSITTRCYRLNERIEKL